MEVWKDIEGYEGSYQVSDHGRVRSLDRIDRVGRKLTGKILKQVYTRGNYLMVGLSKNGIIKLFRVNRLLLLLFYLTQTIILMLVTGMTTGKITGQKISTGRRQKKTIIIITSQLEQLKKSVERLKGIKAIKRYFLLLQ